MKMEYTPFLRVAVNKPHSDVQRFISEIEGFCQMVQKWDDVKVIFVRYQDARCAELAAGKLKANQHVGFVGPMPKWHFFKAGYKPQPDREKPMPGTLMASASSRPLSPQRQKPQRPLPKQPAIFTNAPLSETSPNYMRCSYCAAFPVALQCGACGAFYCNGLCQKRHYEAHIHSCVMPPLVLMQHYDEVNLPEMMRLNNSDAPYVSANGQQPASNNIPKGIQEKINLKTTTSLKKKHEAPSAQVTSGTGAGTSLSNIMSKLMQPQPLLPNFPHVSANDQKPALKNMPKGMPEKINLKTTPSSKKKHEAPSAQVTTGTGAGPSPLNKMPKGMSTLPEKANAKAAPSPAEKAEECQKSALQQADFPAVGATVKISFVGENEIYIYDAGPGPHGRPNAHIKLIRRCLEEGRKKGNTLTKAPVFGDILLAPFSGEYYRAVVNSVEGNWAEVFFVDFGNSEKLEWAEFKTILEPDLKYADRTAHEVWIANISKFTEPIRMQLNELEAEEFELSNVIDMSNTSIKLVELRHPTELYYLSDKLRQLLKKDEKVRTSAEMNKIVVAPDPETYVPVLDDEIIETSIPAENGVELIIIDASYVRHSSSSQIAVLVKANQKKYGEVMSEIHRYGEADQNEYKPQQCGELCLVYFESIWTRAMSTDVQSDTSDYMLFDMGILCSVPLKNVRRFPPKLSRTLYVVTDCIVDNPATLFELAKESTPENLRTKLIKVNVKPDLDSDGSQHVTVISVADTVS
ncbi:uncharacterized protein LOC131209525 [Anopheles bellator]|uniref:uncharacterized protein LOC131209525 n=1 Tax=Anopheles bellator TaxID=139047 RepID=UPI0026491B8E|nr:uncharacterized protein LOC131209525 [Anopheles bellator]